MAWKKVVKVSGGYQAEYWRVSQASYNADDPQQVSIQVISKCYKSESDFLAGEACVKQQVTDTLASNIKAADDYATFLENIARADIGVDS